MRKKLCLTLALTILGLTLPGCPQKEAARTPVETETAVIDAPEVTAERVKQEFLHAWNGYKTYAWGHDALKPLSREPHDWYEHTLLMTPVDAFDTMIIMGLDDEAAEAKELILGKLTFDLDMKVQHFEVSIRILGGLISAYQLDEDERFLELAVDLADRMLPVFDSPTGMPYRFVNLKTGQTSGRLSNPAEIGTYLLEYGALSRLTGDPVYYEKAKDASQALYGRRSKLGLVGTLIDVDTGWWLLGESHVGGGIDSYYEYLLKGWVLFDDPDLKAMWDGHLAAVNKYVADDTGDGLWYGHVNMRSGRRTAHLYGALYAFFPAVLAMGGDLDRAARLEQSCFRMWTLEGVEPELLDYRKMRVLLGNYNLRPEIIESAYYLYHYTGDKEYRRMGRVFFASMVKYCRTDAGYAAISDVRTKAQSDSMESYFLAETLKYFYLLFSPPQEFDFDKAVFNTEAHPIFRTW